MESATHRPVRRGVLIFPQEAGSYWLRLLRESGLNLLGIHPPGGVGAHDTLEQLLKQLKTVEFQRFAHQVAEMGVDLEYEFHAMSWLVPREAFARHPQWFRMDERGERVNDFNICPSCQEALELLEERSALLARRLPCMTTDRYYFWVDDVAGKLCHCPACRELSPSDQVMLLYNHILRGIRRVNPRAAQCYLAYADCIAPPRKVLPDPGIFLEYAPIGRDSALPITASGSEKNREQLSHLDGLLQFFGTRGAQVLEYWMDNSRFWNWKPPYGKLPFYPSVIDADVAFYLEKGFGSLTSFGCGLGEDYADRFSDPPVAAYGKLLEGRQQALSD